MFFEIKYIYSHNSHIHTFNTHNLHKPLNSTSLQFLCDFFISFNFNFNNNMKPQQQQVFEYSQQMNATEQVEASQQLVTTTDAPSTTSYQEPHVLDRPPHINLATPFEKLEVLCELLVDFDNLKENGIDLNQEMENQGWANYFNHLYSPIYTFLVKEFWRFNDCDDHCIVSYIMGIKTVITEKSITKLLNMEKARGRRIYNINPKAKYISQEVIPPIFSQNPEGKSSKNKELHQNLRVWLKIILGTIHHRPSSSSYDYINTD